MRERHVRDVIDVVLRRSGWVRGVRRAEAVLAWPRIVGREVARFATAVAFQNGSLVVEVSDAETAMHLGLQRQHILDAYRARLGNETVRDVRFRVGRMPVAAPSPVPPPPEPDPGEVAAITRTLEPLPEGLAASAAAAARSLSVLRARRRAAGWRPCPVCGTLTEPAVSSSRRGEADPRCGTCRRQADLPKVRSAAERLATAPGSETPALTEDEREVALALAQVRAHARIADLLPRALAEPRRTAELDVAVRCAVALHRGVDLAAVPDLDDVDPTSDGVDTRALRALGRIRPRTPEVPPT